MQGIQPERTIGEQAIKRDEREIDVLGFVSVERPSECVRDPVQKAFDDPARHHADAVPAIVTRNVSPNGGTQKARMSPKIGHRAAREQFGKGIEGNGPIG